MSKLTRIKVVLNLLGTKSIHPFLAATYPILALYVVNVDTVEIIWIIRPLIVSLLTTLALFILFCWVIGDTPKAGIILTLGLALYYSFGHVSEQLQKMGFSATWALFALWCLLLLFGARWAYRNRSIADVQKTANIIMAFLVLMPVGQLLFHVSTNARASGSVKTTVTAPVVQGAAPSGKPDIYYIILDSYTRDDTLVKYFQYDNAPFLQALEARGFFVAYCSQSNYAHTYLSLASTLNMDYLTNLGVTTLDDLRKTNELVYHSRVRSALERLGYTTVSIDVGEIKWEDADIFIPYPQRESLVWGGLNAFEAILMQTTAGALLYDSSVYPKLPTDIKVWLDYLYRDHYNRSLFGIDTLKNLARVPGPKFVFVHFLIPHEPFVFDRNGNFVSRNTPFRWNQDREYGDPTLYQRGYADEMHYFNSLLLDWLDTLDQLQPAQSIVILQGDHGSLARVSSSNARMTIFNAYHLPAGNDVLYTDISPVNTFRVIFDQYFQGDYQMLDDVSYFSDYQNLMKFSIENNIREGCNQ